jgi:glycosyltransferase involved in cell wall biosynthesis
VAYKRYDIAIRAFNRLGLPLKIFGDGPEERNLRDISRPNIEFLGRVAPKDLRRLYSECIAFLHPQEEDFGITLLEANAAGRPVIAYAAGGALETVTPGMTGIYFEEQEWESLADAVIRFQPETYHPEQIREHALTFDTERFKERFSMFVEESYRHYIKKLDSLSKT